MGTMRAELDLFSGRPNPAWELTADQEAEFLRRFRALPVVAHGTIREGLGYRGIVVTVPGGTIDGFDSIVLSGGTALGRRPGGDQTFADRDRALERWLLHTGRGHVNEEVYRTVATELDPIA